MLVVHSIKKRKNKKNNESADCFQQDMAYGDLKDLNRRAAADEILCDKAVNLTWTCFSCL